MEIWLIVAAGFAFLAVEKIFPDRSLPAVASWWPRALLFNAFQMAFVLIAGTTWDPWFREVQFFSLGEYLSLPLQAIIGYVITSFVYYWWHRWRHEFRFLWLSCHQLHHSPQRIETVTAFYKHPLELFANSLLSGATSYILLGLDPQGAALVTGISALSEFFYHVNVKTPRWVGYIIQRPEMHRIHHERGRHTDNFGDLPIWDMLFGTYRNPATFDGACGFSPEREEQIMPMLLFRDVNKSEN